MLEIYAKIIAHSRAPNGQTIVTWELQYPRLILAELNTHRQLSKNSSSSRAIPIQTIIDMVRENPAKPVHWGKNQPGMQAKEELTGRDREIVEDQWETAARLAAGCAQTMAAYGAHKQIANRILEPYQWMKTVLTGTCVDNFFWLRNHADADPTIHALAKAMWESLKESEPVQLEPGDWHVPYFEGGGYWLKGCGVPLEHALAISSSCCAQVSYRKLDDSLEKAESVYDRLVGSEPVHASPFEHQATPMEVYEETSGCGDYIWDALHQDGVTHMDKEGQLWSGNFKGWIQHRQLIPNNVCNNYKELK